ncbi:ODFP1 protein, partial [Chaetops frenatus]|nr:ODFP1 protein [Chaetops frenatus]
SRLKRHGMILKSPCCPSHLALVDMKGFDPSDVSVMVKDGRVTVAAEHEDECNTGLAKTHSHRKFIKEFSLPPAGNENEVTYSL